MMITVIQVVQEILSLGYFLTSGINDQGMQIPVLLRHECKHPLAMVSLTCIDDAVLFCLLVINGVKIL